MTSRIAAASSRDAGRRVTSSASLTAEVFTAGLSAERTPDVVSLVSAGAVFYVCGDGRLMAPAVFEACSRIYSVATGADAADADAWLSEIQREHSRYVADIFA